MTLAGNDKPPFSRQPADDRVLRLVAIPLLALLLPEIAGIRIVVPPQSPIYALTVVGAAVLIHCEWLITLGMGRWTYRSELWLRHPYGIFLFFCAFKISTGCLFAVGGFLAWIHLMNYPMYWLGLERLILSVTFFSVLGARLYVNLHTISDRTFGRRRVEFFRAKGSIADSASQIYRQQPENIVEFLVALRPLIADDPKAAIRAAEDLSAVQRYLLDGPLREAAVLRDELRLLESQVRLLQLRYRVKIDLTVELPEGAENRYQIVPTVLHTFLDGAFRNERVFDPEGMPVRIVIGLDGNVLSFEHSGSLRFLGPSECRLMAALAARVIAATGQELQIDQSASHCRMAIPLTPIPMSGEIRALRR